MKRDPKTMTTHQILLELDTFSWEYVALADLGLPRDEYAARAGELDRRRELLEAERQRRTEQPAQ